MEKAKRAQKAETLKQPSLHLRLSAPHFYPDRTDPRADPQTDVPGGIVPQQHQDTLPLGGQPLAEPGEKGRRDMAHGPVVDKPEPDGVGIGPQQPIAGQGFRVGIVLGHGLRHHAQRLAIRPRVQGRPRQAAPPRLVLKGIRPV